MKSLLITIFSLFILATTSAKNFDSIKIVTKGKSLIEAKFISQKKTTSIVTITNNNGVVINKMKVNLHKGKNTIALVNAATLEEGTFTISITTDSATVSTKFVNLKFTEQAL